MNEDVKLVACDSCPAMIYFKKLRNGRCVPFECDRSGPHICPSRRKGTASGFHPKVFLAARSDFPNSARCGCGNVVGIPTEGGEVRLNRLEWPWSRHTCSRTLESYDGGIDFLIRWCAELDPIPTPILSVVVGVRKISRSANPLVLVAIKTVTREKHCGVVEATTLIPEAGSLVAWCAHDRRRGIVTTGNLWFEWLLDGCPTTKLGLDNWD
jgi:hypothetical protein